MMQAALISALNFRQLHDMHCRPSKGDCVDCCRFCRVHCHLDLYVIKLFIQLGFPLCFIGFGWQTCTITMLTALIKAFKLKLIDSTGIAGGFCFVEVTRKSL